MGRWKGNGIPSCEKVNKAIVIFVLFIDKINKKIGVECNLASDETRLE